MIYSAPEAAAQNSAPRRRNAPRSSLSSTELQPGYIPANDNDKEQGKAPSYDWKMSSTYQPAATKMWWLP